MANFLLENDPKQQKNKKRRDKNVKKIRKIYQCTFSVVSLFPFHDYFAFSYNLILYVYKILSPLFQSLFFYMLSVTLYIYATVNEFHVSFKSRS